MPNWSRGYHRISDDSVSHFGGHPTREAAEEDARASLGPDVDRAWVREVQPDGHLGNLVWECWIDDEGWWEAEPGWGLIIPVEGAWQCRRGHMFRYESPPAWPPWCARLGCPETSDFKWVLKDSVTAKDWL